MVNQLAVSRQIEVLSLLTEGNSLRATARLTGVDRNTIMRLSGLVGSACDRLHHARMRDLQVSRLELDETWSFVQKKQKRVETHHPAEQGGWRSTLTAKPLSATGSANGRRPMPRRSWPTCAAAW